MIYHASVHVSFICFAKCVSIEDHVTVGRTSSWAHSVSGEETPEGHRWDLCIKLYPTTESVEAGVLVAELDSDLRSLYLISNK